ncbi:hypothetical protein [Cellulomonas fimi]|uniref:Uncharacterized protein n=1 Tax=Cellulomonas fimi TaxID=1708 RepID=A0A7Y0LZD9_CELFI|nr:hypothetical protein [Cellulomonas fimi]NMR20218.1 hypothetical protein [Cellulomonas fimi]
MFMPAGYDVMWTLVVVAASVIPLVIGALILYWVVRRAVRDGIRDATPPTPPSSAHQTPG